MARGWYEEKLAKVKRYDALDRSENEGHRVAGDYASGRKVFPIYNHNGKAYWQIAYLAEKYDRWTADPKNRMTPTERILVADCEKHGVPVARRYQRNEPQKTHSSGFKSAVYLDSGCRLLFDTSDEALDYFVAEERAVKMWDAGIGKYLTK